MEKIFLQIPANMFRYLRYDLDEDDRGLISWVQLDYAGEGVSHMIYLPEQGRLFFPLDSPEWPSAVIRERISYILRNYLALSEKEKGNFRKKYEKR